MDRRDFLRVGAAMTAGVAARPGAGEDRPPNVVLIISDDQHWGDYGFMGHPHIRTPNLDRLAERSVVFTRGYVASPLCCPSLGAMLTGLHPHRNGITTNDPPVPKGMPRGAALRSPEARRGRERMIRFYETGPALPRLLAGRGYVSFQSGKWWGGHYRNGGFTEGMTHGDPDKGGRHGDAGLAIGRETMEPVFDFIRASRNRPFFLWYAPFLPHSPHNPPEGILDRYRDVAPSIHVARYWAMCEWFDDTCGRLLDRLEAEGVADNTLIVYACDNGWIQDAASAKSAPRSKLSPYEGGVRTPILVCYPGKARPRRDEHTPVSTVDLAPTILRAAGLAPAPGMEGVDLLDPEAVASRPAVFGAMYSHDAVDVEDPAANLRVRWCVRGGMKLLAPDSVNVPDGRAELYDVAGDPAETKDLAAANPDTVAELWGLIREWWDIPGREAPPIAARGIVSPDDGFAAGRSPWQPVRDIADLRVGPDGMRFRVTGADPILTLFPCEFRGSEFGRITVRMSATAGSVITLFWSSTGVIRGENKLVLPLVADGAIHEYVFEVREEASWQGAHVKRVRIDPCDAPGTVRIESIRALRGASSRP